MKLSSNGEDRVPTSHLLPSHETSIDCSLKIDSKAPLLRQHLQNTLYMEKSRWYLHRVFGRGKYSPYYQKKNTNTNSATDHLIYSGVMPIM